MDGKRRGAPFSHDNSYIERETPQFESACADIIYSRGVNERVPRGEEGEGAALCRSPDGIFSFCVVFGVGVKNTIGVRGYKSSRLLKEGCVV